MSWQPTYDLKEYIKGMEYSQVAFTHALKENEITTCYDTPPGLKPDPARLEGSLSDYTTQKRGNK